MLLDFATYLLQGTALLTIFALAYRLFFCRLTYFHWNRGYLLASAVIGCLLPLLPAFSIFGTVAPAGLEFRFHAVPYRPDGLTVPSPNETALTVSGWDGLGYGLLGLYLLGFLYKSGQLYHNLRAVVRLMRTSPQVDQSAFYSVYVQSNLPTFSFGRSIFLNPDTDALTPEEQAQVLLHEEIHVQHRHTLDLLLFELVGLLFWFNPVVRYLHVSIRQVHEYTVDSRVVQRLGNVRQYGYLLLKMTAQAPLPLLTSFSNKPVFSRIQMLTQKPSGPMQKLKFLIVLPLLALSLFFCSCFRTDDRPALQVDAVAAQTGVPIGTLVWKGNQVYSTERLNEVLGIRPGDRYDKETFENRLFNRMGTDIASLYMDKGYLFFNVAVHEKRVGNAINLELEVFEGNPVNVDKVVFKGNQHVSNEQLLEAIAVRPGALFNRSKLIESQRTLAALGYFDPQKIGINPVPNIDRNTVDLEFVVVEK